jgi:hypothetical protein
MANREFNRTIDDPCALQQRSDDNAKKLKFITTNHRDLLEAKENYNFFGMTIKDKLFVPSDQIDESSDLRQGDSTNCKTKFGFGPLPLPTLPARYQMYHGDVDVEDSMRNFTNNNRRSCQSTDPNFHSRHFYIFDGPNLEAPDAGKSVEDRSFGPRGGVSTRFLQRMNKQP